MIKKKKCLEEIHQKKVYKASHSYQDNEDDRTKIWDDKSTADGGNWQNQTTQSHSCSGSISQGGSGKGAELQFR